MGLFSRLFGYIWDFFAGAALNTLDAGLQTNPVTLLLLIGGITIWLGAACWAASIAEARLYSPKLHFFAGLFLPILYPIILLFAMDVKYQKTAAGTDSGTAAAPEQAPEEDGDAPEEDEEENVPEFDQDYFKEISRDENGNFVGPWRITFGDNEAVAQKIVDPLPHVVVIETVPSGSKGKPQRLRIPYGKIEACVRA